MNFNELEMDIAKEIIHIGLTKAADSMSFFLKEKVFIRSLDFKMTSSDPLVSWPLGNSEAPVFVLSTELRGELGGICYLLFSDSEAEKLLKLMMPESVLKKNPEKAAEMTKEILLEIDNIIVASVVTQFANFFKYKTHGDVPHIMDTTRKEFKEYVRVAGKNSDYCLYFRSEFHTTGIDMAPEFIWLLNDKYFEGVKAVAGDSDLLNKIRMI